MDEVLLLNRMFEELKHVYNGIIDLENDIKTTIDYKDPNKLLTFLAGREKMIRLTEELMRKISEAESEIMTYFCENNKPFDLLVLKKYLPANEYQTIVSSLKENEELLSKIIMVEEENLTNGKIVLEDMKLQLSRIHSVKKARSTYGSITRNNEPRFIDQED